MSREREEIKQALIKEPENPWKELGHELKAIGVVLGKGQPPWVVLANEIITFHKVPKQYQGMIRAGCKQKFETLKHAFEVSKTHPGGARYITACLRKSKPWEKNGK